MRSDRSLGLSVGIQIDRRARSVELLLQPCDFFLEKPPFSTLAGLPAELPVASCGRPGLPELS